MKDGAQSKLPQWPPRVLFFNRGRERAVSDTDDDAAAATADKNNNNNRSTTSSTTFDADPEANKSSDAMLGSTEPSYKRLRSPESARVARLFRQRRIRWVSIGILAFGTVTIILLSTLLTRHSVGGLDSIFKKTSTLTLNQGKYVGQVLGPSPSSPRPVQVYLGIPYAQTTAGNNRFRPPQMLETAHSDKTYHALKLGQICPQAKPDRPGHGENCLNANIYRPHFGDDAEEIAKEEERLGVNSTKLPVVVYVHGGGFNMGAGKERNMASFAAFADSPIIGISFNYRVGPLGFLPSAITAKQGLLNLGLKDQQFFLEWMRNNLPAIGGDPENVTLMGLSAGSHSIGHQLISYSPANKLNKKPPPFQKAIIESGGSTARATFVPDHPLHEEQFQEFLSKVGIMEVMDEDKLFDKLREIPYNTIVSAQQAMWRTWADTLRWPFQPVIDGPGGVIPDLPVNSWKKGNVLRIPILTGFNTNEGATFVPEHENESSAVRVLMKSIIPALNETDLTDLDELYPSPSTTNGTELYAKTTQSKRFGTEFWRLDDAYAHYAYICPVLQTATLASSFEDAAPIYVYHYAPRSSSFGAADHADEGPIVTHDMSSIGKHPGLIAVADAMTGAWTRFAATGNPNKSQNGDESAFKWPRYFSPFDEGDADSDDDDAGRLALFGEGNDERMGKNDKGTPVQDIALTTREKSQCKYWWPRVVLSEGWGNGSTSRTSKATSRKDTGSAKIKSKL